MCELHTDMINFKASYEVRKDGLRLNLAEGVAAIITKNNSISKLLSRDGLPGFVVCADLAERSPG